MQKKRHKTSAVLPGTVQGGRSGCRSGCITDFPLASDLGQSLLTASQVVRGVAPGGRPAGSHRRQRAGPA